MTPNEQRLMLEMLRDAARDAVREEMRPVVARIAALEEVDKKLAADDRKLSGQHKVVLNQTLPKLATDLSIERTEDMKAFTLSFTRMATFVGDLADQVARMDARQKLGLVEVPDGKGGQSVKPASMLAAESAQRTEGKTDALAIDTTATADGVRSIKAGQKVLIPVATVASAAAVLPYVVDIVKTLWHAIH